MNKYMSIIIPYHNEDKELFRPLLSSLDTQIGIDFNEIEVIITNNSPHEEIKNLDNLFIEYENIYPFIRYEECPYKSSMGPNREYGMSLAIGTYIMFCDFDDVLYSPLSLYTIFNSLTDDYDMYDFYSIKELDPRDKQERYGDSIFEINKTNPVLLHGKVYRRQYLIDKNIHFCHKLFAWEDMYFNQLIEQNKPRRIEKPVSVYIWKFRQSSVSKEMGPEIVYQTKHWKDGILKNYYIFEYLKKYNTLSNKEFSELFINTVANWYLDPSDTYMNPTGVEEIYGYIIKTFDPELKYLVKKKKYPYKSPTRPESFEEYVSRLIKNIDLEKINQKYNIGHFDDKE